MLFYILKRFLQMVVVIAIVGTIVFIFVNMLGDPAVLLLPPEASPEELAKARAVMGLDKSSWEQYKIFVVNVLHGNLGNSFVFREPAMRLIFERMPATLEIVVLAMFLAAVIAIPLGVYVGAHPNTFISRSILSLSLLCVSMPTFWFGIVLILIFSVQLGWLPSSGRGDVVILWGMRFSFMTWDGIRHLVLPAITLAVQQLATQLRLTRAGMMEVLRQDYIKFAKAKGVSPHNVLYGHALKNALIPVVTVYGLEFGGLIVFATITETIFAWPGMGKLLIDSINISDRPVIIAYLMLASMLFVVINFVVDILYTLIDPRIDLR